MVIVVPIVDSVPQVNHQWSQAPAPGDSLTLGVGTPSARTVRVVGRTFYSNTRGDLVVDLHCEEDKL